MPLFVCDKCNTLENTALGFYHCRRNAARMLGQGYKDGEALCSACAPALFSDGSINKKGGWHEKFTRRQWDGKEEVINRDTTEVTHDR